MSVPTGPVISGVNEVGMSSVTQDISVRVPAALNCERASNYTLQNIEAQTQAVYYSRKPHFTGNNWGKY